VYYSIFGETASKLTHLSARCLFSFQLEQQLEQSSSESSVSEKKPTHDDTVVNNDEGAEDEQQLEQSSLETSVSEKKRTKCVRLSFNDGTVVNNEGADDEDPNLKRQKTEYYNDMII
jgi:hypothetical protein